MRGAICRANRQIIQAASIGQQFKGMGTTVVMGLFYRDRVIAAHVGDSRLYRFRQGELRLLTRDHSLFQEQLDAGLIKAGSKRLSSNQNFLTRAVGVGREIEIDARSHSTQEGDLFLFCSDGISDMLSNQQIGAILCEHGAIPDLACDALIANANAQGGMDNSSVILVKIESGPQEKKGFLGRVFTRLMRVPSSSFFRLT
jgi:protein phosphatase